MASANVKMSAREYAALAVKRKIQFYAIIVILVIILVAFLVLVLWVGSIDGEPLLAFNNMMHADKVVTANAIHNDIVQQKREDAIDISVDNDQLYQLLIDEFGCSEMKALGLTACYTAMTQLGYTPQQAAILMGCGMHEGAPGLVQYSYPRQSAINSASGDVSLIHVSGYDNPLYIRSGEMASQLSLVQRNGDGMGIGTAQWTNNRCATYISLLLELYGANEYTNEMLYAADLEMYTRELTGSYANLKKGMDERSQSTEAMMVYTFYFYEAGFGYYKPGQLPDNIAAYVNAGVTAATGMEKRYKSAVELIDAFKSIS